MQKAQGKRQAAKLIVLALATGWVVTAGATLADLAVADVCSRKLAA